MNILCCAVVIAWLVCFHFVPMLKSIFLLAATAVARPAQDRSYLNWMAHSFKAIGLTDIYGWSSYEHATLYSGLEKAYELSGDEEIYEWYKGLFEEHIIADDGSLKDWPPPNVMLDHYRFGMNLLWFYEETGEEKWRIAADTIRREFDTYPRLNSGGFLHGARFGPEMWLDGIFMGDSFYAKWTDLFDKDNTTAWDDIILQFDVIDNATRVDSGLLVHGFDESKKQPWADPVTGASPNVWNRAMGWYFLALLEVLEVLPESHPGYNRLVSYFTETAVALKETQDPESGNWWLVMNEPYPGMERNYIESSASAMFTAGWLKGIRYGYLSSEEYLDPAKTAYKGLVDNFIIVNENNDTLTWDGTVLVGALDTNATFEYYTSVPLVRNDMRGGGAFLLAAYEYESLAEKA